MWYTMFIWILVHPKENNYNNTLEGFHNTIYKKEIMVFCHEPHKNLHEYLQLLPNRNTT